MRLKKIVTCLAILGLVFIVDSCSKETKSTGDKNMLVVDIGSDIATLDPQTQEDVQSARVAYDLFEGLVSFDQSNKPIPGLAEKWDISEDGKTYTFHLRDGLKFSDGSPITPEDIIFSFQRLADPKIASPYNFLVENIVNGDKIVAGKAKPDTLGIKALDAKTIQIILQNPDSAFLSICSQPQLGIVSKTNVTKFGQAWIEPKNMVTSGAYKIDERIVQGYILESKNPNYYDAKNVAIEKVKFLPIVDSNAALSGYKTGDIDITYKLPIDQYKAVKSQFPKEEHTILWEADEYYNFNMMSPKFKNNLKLRQALTMAVDRDAMVKDIMGQDQKPMYSYITDTVEGGKFAGLDYEWAKLPREEQIKQARELFKEAGYGPKNPLTIEISYNTRDDHKKKAIATAAMWTNTFGTDSIKVTATNQEWKTFIQTRNKGNFDIARGGWVADYDSADSYTTLYLCNNPLNNAHSCTKGYNELVKQASTTNNADERINLIKQALKLAQDDYSIIPLYQETYYRLINPRVQGYDIDINHLDHVQSKWLSLK